MRTGVFATWLIVALGCEASQSTGYVEGEELSGGLATTMSQSDQAYNQPAAGLSVDDEALFQVGNNLNGATWIVAPASVTSRDGLGPIYNATSCSSCHVRDGRGRPPMGSDEMLSSLVRISIPGTSEHGGPLGDPVYGDQLQPRAIPGVLPEARTRVGWQETAGQYADGTAYSLRLPILTITDWAYGEPSPSLMTSMRVAPPQYGLGLLESIAESAILANADPDDIDGDGISGRPNRVWNGEAGQEQLGRFGWKANQPTLRSQVAGAFNGDIGITSALVPDSNCPSAQASCLDVPNGDDEGGYELSDTIFDAIVHYSRLLAVPARRDAADARVLRGKALFMDAGCASCHVPRFETGESEFAALSRQTIFPYSDLLLHEMGEGLADGRPDYLANGKEWRTPPLWGIGLLETVNGHLELMHDGRARGFAEAILWHGGEAEASRDAFRSMSAEEREALLRFLQSL